MSRHRHHRHSAENASHHESRVPYWQRAHRDWRLWVGVVLMFAAMVIYVMTMDLRVRSQPVPQPIEGPGGR